MTASGWQRVVFLKITNKCMEEIYIMSESQKEYLEVSMSFFFLQCLLFRAWNHAKQYKENIMAFNHPAFSKLLAREIPLLTLAFNSSFHNSITQNSIISKYWLRTSYVSGVVQAATDLSAPNIDTVLTPINLIILLEKSSLIKWAWKCILMKDWDGIWRLAGKSY